MGPSCSRCRFWERAHPENDLGKCRRYPPHVLETESAIDLLPGAVIVHSWPYTLANNWCGEFASGVIPYLYPFRPTAN